jgi:endonuclease/exonuclease/phosphatase family metal-dependent hydrolase
MKRTLHITLLAGLTSLILLLPSAAKASDGDSLKVLSWNIYMLPANIFSLGQAKRVHYIAEQLNNSDYDVIVFQEAFDRDARYILSKAMRQQFPYQEGPANAKPAWFRMNSGVWIVSRYPVKYLDELEYSQKTGVDKVARKGVLLVEINKNGKRYQIAGTHLQSGASEKKNQIRISQYNEIHSLMQKHEREGVTQLICGDFNTPKNDRKYYNLMLETLKAQDGPLESSLQFTYCGKENDLASGSSSYSEVLDYIFIKENNSHIKYFRRNVVAFKARWHESKNNLSDHFAVELFIVTE